MLSAAWTVGALLWLAATGRSLQVVPNSPCESVCNPAQFGTTQDDIVCLDSDYTATTNGSRFERCVSCELTSSAIDPKTGTSDPLWALYNLRYAVSECMFGFPAQIISPSSPCQVSCQPLSPGVTMGLQSNASSTDLSFCNAGNFTDGLISQCVFCYGLLDQQKYIANFLQALDIACHDPPSPTNPFPVPASAIFNQTAIQPPATSGAASSKAPLSGTNLVLAIVLPIVGVIFILAFTCCGCFFLTRRRRRDMAAMGKMRRIHESWADISPITPRTGQLPFGWDRPISMEDVRGRSWDGSGSGSHYVYRDDVGPGPGQKKDHQLHNQYFAPSPQPGASGPDDADDDEYPRDVKADPANFIHSPAMMHDDGGVGTGLAHGGLPTGDRKDARLDWM